MDTDGDRDRGKVAAISAAGALVVVLAASLGFVLFQVGAPSDKFEACRVAKVAGGQTLGGTFELTNDLGERVNSNDVFARPSLLYFGYTYCPDVCPFDVVRNADAVDLVAEQGLDLQAVLITVDPDRDTVEALQQYTDAIHEDMLGLTGTAREIKEVMADYGVVASKVADDPEFYLVSHTTLSYLVMPDHGVVAFFPRTLSAEELAAQTICFLDAA